MPYFGVVQGDQKEVFLAEERCRDQLEEGHVDLVEEADVPAHFRGAGEVAAG
jgi:hypothetical protein